MLGRDLVDEFKKTGGGFDKSNPYINEKYNVIPTDIPELDITQDGVIKKIKTFAPDLVLHIAAYTNVDGCELEPEKALQVNAMGTKNVATVCKELEIPLLYISTDYVFDGENPIPYVEWDQPNPLNVYGQTKLEGELWVKRLVKDYWIIRTSGLYGRWGKNFVDTIIKKAKEVDTIKVVADQTGSPTYTKDLANAIKKLIRTDNFGIYHITNSGWCSWYEFAQTIIGTYGKITCDVLPISSDELNRPAKRPKNFRLLNFAWDTIFKEPLRTWQEALNEYIKLNRRKY
jgi:dTDP-4-dehydrorhamnose reductase